ncbi:MAG: glycosyltransferase 87 family protein [Actinomycetota bacterium]|nr:glycosyltransferase 87 family protein [Actinomycetota bacterium]MDQ2983010.1 glycosyltransferase 87 family protein [Actinomycetota bacterium]
MRAVAAGIAAGAVFVVSWALIHHGFYARDQIVDTPVYQQYGDLMAEGKVPYRDFELEYPPAALPVFLLPSLGHERGDLEAYRRRFEPLMALCGLLAIAAVAVALASLGASWTRLAAALGLLAVSPLLIGSTILSRFDLWPAALAAGAVAAVLSRREKLGAAALGLAFAAKLWPAVLLPPVAVYVWRRRGRHDAVVAAGLFAAAAAACLLPFAIASPHGVWESLMRQTGRPLQIESLGAAILFVAHQVGGLGLTMESSRGSQNLAGSTPDLLATILTVAQVASIAGVWVWFARGPADRERLVRALAASAVAFVAFGKVLSPQFLIWLVPLVPLVRGRRGLAAGGLLAVALVLTQIWFPHRYWRLPLEFDATVSWLVFARDVALVALLAVLLLPSRPKPEPVRS